MQPTRILGGVSIALLLAGCGVGYVLSSGYYQLELLASRKKNEKVLEKGLLGPEEEERLRLIPRIKEYGRGIGLSSTQNYNSTAVNWNRELWNISASSPLRFEPKVWRFPIVGQVPYLGFFTEEAVRRWEKRLLEEGYDVYVRPVGAYSTLGWFRDPILPNMLRWDEDDLAEVVFHELAHATLWVKGSVEFNESFANFVGLQTMFRYLADKYGPDSPELFKAKQKHRDQRRFEALLHELYQELDALFQDTSLTDVQKLTRKEELYGSLESRVMQSEIEQKERYVAAVRRAPWNNARLIQFKTYNTNEELFAALLAKHDGNLRRFIEDIRQITRKSKDPFVSLAKAAAPYLKEKEAPASQPQTEPASLPASLPAPTPESAPASQPASQPESAPTHP